jgi:hypothetical protein
MAVEWKAHLEQIGLKRILIYGSFAYAFIGLMELFGRLPDILKNDKAAIVIAGHILWLLIRAPAECFILAFVIFSPVLFIWVLVEQITLAITFHILPEYETNLFFGYLAFLSAIIGGIFLRHKYGYVGFFLLITNDLEYCIKQSPVWIQQFQHWVNTTANRPDPFPPESS